MAEPTVQVPVSRIERARAVVESEVDETWVFRAQEALRALLSQPTPSAEPEESGVCHCGTPMSDHSAWDNHNPVDMSYPTSESKFREQYVHVPEEWHPPRIEDMAPGTTDPFANRPQVRHLARRHDVIETEHGTWLLDWYRPTEPYIRKVDPSTIRDVTPPKEPTA